MMFATLYLPNFYLQALLRHQPDLIAEAVAVIDDVEAKPTFVQVNAAAEAAGVSCGMTPSQGLARHLPLRVKARQRAQEEAIAALLLQLAATLTPFFEATAPGLCTLQFQAAKNLRARLEQVVAQLSAMSLTAQAGIAPTPDISFLAAHLARPVLEVAAIEDFLAPLPLETLMIR